VDLQHHVRCHEQALADHRGSPTSTPAAGARAHGAVQHQRAAAGQKEESGCRDWPWSGLEAVGRISPARGGGFVRQVQDRLRAPVVLLELITLQPDTASGKSRMSDRGAAERVDRLRVVPHHHHVPFFADNNRTISAWILLVSWYSSTIRYV